MKHPDWHKADIIAGLKKKGTSLAALSRESGLASSTLANALTRHWPKGERLIAKVLNTQPEVIWPSRYQGHKIENLSGRAAGRMSGRDTTNY
ncbi:regulator [Kosakonia radicincitans DSM 16656]|uniref:helix-turn-helix domain-containing protein n=1 Tax=Kosakonia radicincitans TaxID=283686 RepID=UPI000272FC9B|nr:helix-turn-helix transcriptional regulator [Kosakonia radicincitans]ARD59668.1 regulator [Kosakonia radicincitans DSM 16656]KDE35265.1 DNA-binding protein [Kosakonia radicincitans UMEnt01/12]MDD7994716.1 helix-turn-helix transcriptional regulator [Kosakonia radicincitans]